MDACFRHRIKIILIIKDNLKDNNSDFLLAITMEACFRHRIIKKKEKVKIIATFYLKFLTFFSELQDLNLQLRVINSELQDIKS